jgi:hypothetical protein
MPNSTVKKDRIRRRKTSSNQQHVAKFAGDAYSLASRAYKGVQAITRLINIETKHLDFVGTFTVSTTPTIVYVSALAQGTDDSQRIGDSIRCQSLELKTMVRLDLASTGYTSLHLLLVRDLQNSGATPTMTDVYDTTSNPTLQVWLNRDRYNILFDEHIVLNREVGPVIDDRRVMLPASGHIKYRLTTSAAAAAAAGSLYLMAWSSLAAGGAVPTLNYAVRLTYTDD